MIACHIDILHARIADFTSCSRLQLLTTNWLGDLLLSCLGLARLSEAAALASAVFKDESDCTALGSEAVICFDLFSRFKDAAALARAFSNDELACVPSVTVLLLVVGADIIVVDTDRGTCIISHLISFTKWGLRFRHTIMTDNVIMA